MASNKLGFTSGLITDDTSYGLYNNKTGERLTLTQDNDDTSELNQFITNTGRQSLTPGQKIALSIAWDNHNIHSFYKLLAIITSGEVYADIALIPGQSKWQLNAISLDLDQQEPYADEQPARTINKLSPFIKKTTGLGLSDGIITDNTYYSLMKTGTGQELELDTHNIITSEINQFIHDAGYRALSTEQEKILKDYWLDGDVYKFCVLLTDWAKTSTTGSLSMTSDSDYDWQLDSININL